MVSFQSLNEENLQVLDLANRDRFNANALQGKKLPEFMQLAEAIPLDAPPGADIVEPVQDIKPEKPEIDENADLDNRS